MSYDKDQWYAASLARSAALRPQTPAGDKKLLSSQIRAARMIGKLSKDIRKKLYDAQKGKCPCCGRDLGKSPHLDHIMPLALGGTNVDENMQLLRAACNMQKSKSHPDVFIERRKRQDAYWKERGLKRRS